jgi:hypothetical protein
MWSYHHKCAATLQIHAIQELYELFSDDEVVVDCSSLNSSEDTSHLCLCISKAVATRVDSPHSMRLLGTIQGHEVLMFLDSGSSHTFIKTNLASQLSRVTSLSKPLSVQVADGAVIFADRQLLQAEWHIQGYQFYSDFKVLPLQHFDVILGYD